MAKVVYSPVALEAIERAFEFIAEKDEKAAARAVEAIGNAIAVLPKHPLIGRSIGDGVRELVISHGATGYVALYWVSPDRAEVQVLALRHQRELGYPD